MEKSTANAQHNLYFFNQKKSIGTNEFRVKTRIFNIDLTWPFPICLIFGVHILDSLQKINQNEIP